MMVDVGGTKPGVDLEVNGLYNGMEVAHGDSKGMLNIVDGLVGGLWHGSRHRQRPGIV